MSKQPTKPIVLTVKEVSELLRIHRPKVYDLIKDGTLHGIKIGADWRIRTSSVEGMIGAIPGGFFTETSRKKTNNLD